MKTSVAIMVAGEVVEMPVGETGIYAGVVDALEETDMVCLVTEREDGSFVMQNVFSDCTVSQ